MRFRWNGREFTTPTIREGLLGGYSLGELRWLKKQLGIPRIEDLDAAEARVAGFALAIRREDHTLLPINRDTFDRIAMADFELVAHPVTDLDDDGDCAECSQPVHARIHQASDTTPAAAARPTGPEDQSDQRTPTPTT